MRKGGAVLVMFVLVLVACSRERDGTDRSGSTNAAPLAIAASLESFDGCPEFLDHVRTEGKRRVGPYGLPGGFDGRAVAMEQGAATRSAGADAGAAAAAPAQDTSAFSQTNIQEAGVDEPDRVKTNGRYIFTVRNRPDGTAQHLIAISTADGRPRVAGRLPLQTGNYELLLARDRIVAISTAGFAVPVAERATDVASPVIGPEQYKEETSVLVIDAADPASMKIANKLTLQGIYASARMVDSIVRVVLNTTTAKPQLEAPAEPGVAGSEKDALERNKERIERSKVEEWLPSFELTDDSGKVIERGPVATCASVRHPKTFSGFDSTSVVTIDPASPDPRNSAAVLGGAGVVYASTGNLYVATQRWPDVQPLVIEDRAIGMPAPVPAPTETQLHRFDISDPKTAVYAASGEVKGTVLNQWSMSEHDGFLRVATTETKFGQQASTSESFVSVFDAKARRLAQVGQVGGLGKDERIFGVRFIADVGYVVTFRQIDPLYVVDLADPRRPRVRGELKIPGYSAYLHPVGDGRIIGIGQDATAEGQAQGTQVALFDVSDPGAPKQLDKVVFKMANSPVESDHHAFLWWAASKLAVVPINQFENQLGGERGSAIGFRFEGDEISEVGRASHLRHTIGSDQDWVLSTIDRSIVVGDVLYTLSQNGVLASDLGSFDERGWLPLSV